MTCVFAIFARGPVTDLLRYVFYYKEVCFEMTCVFAISARGHVTDLLRYVFYYKEVCFEMTCVFAISARGHVTDLLRYVFYYKEVCFLSSTNRVYKNSQEIDLKVLKTCKFLTFNPKMI